MDPQADKVIGLMEKMKLTESEKKSLKIGGGGGRSVVPRIPQAIGKVLAENLVDAENLAAALGRVWCPLKGIECKAMGENRFLITFLQESGKVRAMDDGPWMFGKDLIVLADFDGKKLVDEVEFITVPIWIMVSKLPLGLMNKTAGEEIGDMVGEVMKVDVDTNGLAFGESLRIKIRLDIRKPLMRGVCLDRGSGKEENIIWCPLSYEFLPEFCYTCGIIGHTDKICGVKVMKGEDQQFSKHLRFTPEKKRFLENFGSRGSGNNSFHSGEEAFFGELWQ